MAYKTAAEMFGDGGGFGPAVPYSTANPPGTSAGNRGIQFGEQLTAAIANRTHYALALNTDDINTRLAVFEADGLDAAYRGGALATPGSGRLIVKDGGAVETTSTLAAQYADDVANAHFRADATGDTTSGGGFDFRGSSATPSAYGFLSRTNVNPSTTHTTISISEPVTLNPGGVGGDVVRFVGNVHNGSETDVALRALDLLEITGSVSSDGLYYVQDLGAATTDFLVLRLDGTAPVFTAGDSGVCRFFLANAASSAFKLGTGGSASKSALALSATSQEDTILGLFSRDKDGVFGTGSDASIQFYYRNKDGGVSAFTSFTPTGRLKSRLNADGFATESLDIQRLEGGLPTITLQKEEGGATGFHEIGVLVTDTAGQTSSYAGLETRGRIVDATLGINFSLGATFAAPTGMIILDNSDGTVPPPVGLDQTGWIQAVQPGATLVQILSPALYANRYYLMFDATCAGPGSPWQVRLRHPDGSSLLPGELPTAGPLTFTFVSREVIGGRTTPLVPDTVPLGFTAPANITPNNVLSVSTDTYGDPAGIVAAMVLGPVIGARSVRPGSEFGGYRLLDIPWAIAKNGLFTTQTGYTAGSSAALYTAQDPAGFSANTAASSATMAATAVAVTNFATTAQMQATNITVSGGGNTSSITNTAITSTNGPSTSTVAAASVTSASFLYPAPVARSVKISPYKFGGFITAASTPGTGEWFTLLGPTVASSIDTAALWLDLSGILRSGCVITSVVARVLPTARATLGDRMLLSLVRLDNLGASSTLASQRDDGLGGAQPITATPGSPVTLDFSSFSYYVTLLAGTDAPGPHSQDIFYGLTINYTDPGPRNH